MYAPFVFLSDLSAEVIRRLLHCNSLGKVRYNVRFADVFLRLGSALVGWMVLYAYVLWLAALNALGCGPDADEMHRLLFGMAPVACCFAILLRVTRPLSEVHSILRWLGVPLLLSSPFVFVSIWKTFYRANLESLAICSNSAAALWERAWAPTQLLMFLIIAYLLIRMLKVGPTEKQ